ncbi:MAG: glycosyltransferase [Pseudobdellovibrio sp.]
MSKIVPQAKKPYFLESIMNVKSSKTKSLNILHTPVNIGGLASTTSASEKERGHKSDVVVQYDSWTKFTFDKLFVVKGKYDFLGILKRATFALFSIFKYDIFNFYFGRTLLTWDDSPVFKPFRHWDIILAKKLGKKTIAIYQGCDIRIASASHQRNAVTMCASNHCKLYQNCLNYTDNYRLNMFNELSPYYDHIFFLNPELGFHLPNAQFLPYAVQDAKKCELILPKVNRRPVILHAPSDSSIKGTSYIVSALEKLKAEFDFEFKLVQNLPHHEAMELYRDADLVIDQVLAGWYGAFAVELMSMGKPVACYIREEDLKFIPEQMKQDLPLLRISPLTIEADLRTLLQNQNKWTEWGLKSRDFAIKWHDPEKISKALEDIYTNRSKSFNYEKMVSS